jgi:phosphoglycolate phosphatase
VPEPDAVLFDLDGVLLDSRLAIVRCLEHALGAHGLPVPPRAQLAGYIGPPLLDAFAELAGPQNADACLATYRERYAVSSLVETTVAPGAAAALAAVAADVPVAIATTKPHAYAIPLCERLGLAGHVQGIFGPELDAADELKAVTIARALAALGLRPGADAPMVGDRRHDVEAARANGLSCVGVLWGIGDEAELRAAGAEPIVRHPAELPAALGLRRAGA